jgi:alpha-N-arabinofuranosidase
MITLFRGPKPSGPFEPAPKNPILTQRDHLLERVQATGHGDLVQARDGSWWLVFLGIRNFGSPMHMMHTLGRETFLAPVRWGDDGWPVVNDGQPIGEEVASTLPAQPWPARAVRDGFDARALGPDWVSVRNPSEGRASLTETPGVLTLHGAAESLDDFGAPAFVARRQEHLRARAATELAFDPKAEGDEAGLSVFYDESHHYDLAVVRRAGRRTVIVRRRSNDLRAEVAAIAAPDGPVRLEIETNPWTYFFFLGSGAGRVLLAKARATPISTESAGGFTGTMLALYATGDGKPASAPARFDWFDYEPLPDEPPRRR